MDSNQVLVFGLLYAQFAMFILNAALQLNLEMVQLYSPFLMVFCITLLGLTSLYMK